MSMQKSECSILFQDVYKRQAYDCDVTPESIQIADPVDVVLYSPQMKECVEPLVEWFREHKRDLPWRKRMDAYRVWISEIMLQQTRVEAVKPYYERFLKELPDVCLLYTSSCV